ncbi:hypothetical protein I4U23_005047 [Adineta vaga]|nr:hypothetical protein I4U23_005047 [Adineta vaga]
MISGQLFCLLYLFSIIQSVYLATYSCDPHASCGCSQFPVNTNKNIRIVGRENAGFNTLSWTVAIPQGEDLCGGAIIHESFVLSAAHCFKSNLLLSNLTIYAGSLKYRDGIKKTVSRVYLYPNYTITGFVNDIALLELTTPLNLSDVNLAKICLTNITSTVGEYPPAGTSLLAAGWGTLSSGGPFPDTLQQVTIQAVGAQTSYCESIITDPIIQLCAGTMPHGGKDTCQGDSGGPLIMFNSNQQWELVGVVSYGQGCALPKLPGVYTRASSYIKWINTIIHEPNIIDFIPTTTFKNCAYSFDTSFYFALLIFISFLNNFFMSLSF